MVSYDMTLWAEVMGGPAPGSAIRGPSSWAADWLLAAEMPMGGMLILLWLVLLWLALAGLLGTACATWSNAELGSDIWLLFGAMLLPGLIMVFDLLGLVM